MRERASTFGSAGVSVLVFGLAVGLGSGGSPVLVSLGAIAATLGVAAVIQGTVLHIRASDRDRCARITSTLHDQA